MYCNARSLPQNGLLHALVSIHKPDAIFIVETWFCPDITAAEVSLPGYSTVRVDRDRHGSSIIIFVADINNVRILQQQWRIQGVQMHPPFEGLPSHVLSKSACSKFVCT